MSLGEAPVILQWFAGINHGKPQHKAHPLPLRLMFGPRCLYERAHDRVPGPRGRGYVMNVASAKNGLGYGAWTQIDGRSQAVVEYIGALDPRCKELPLTLSLCSPIFAGPLAFVGIAGFGQITSTTDHTGRQLQLALRSNF